MKPCIALHCLVAALAVGQFATASPEPVWKQVYAAAGSFHECPIPKDAASFAAIHTLTPPARDLELNGRHVAGFGFVTPDGMDGDLRLLFAWPDQGQVPMRPDCEWWLLSDNDGPPARLDGPRDFNAADFPVFRAKFPDCVTFSLLTVPQRLLEKRSRYQLCLTFPDARIPAVRFAISVASWQGVREFGMLPIGYPGGGPLFPAATEEIKNSGTIVAEVVAAYRADGSEAGLRHLDREWLPHLQRGGDFYKLYAAVWREGQTQSGRDDPAWGASLFEWLQQRCLSMGAIYKVEELCHNTYSTLLNVRRIGAARHALQPFVTGMARRGIDLDPKNHPDAGPALACLPEIRLRRVPDDSAQGMPVITWLGDVALNHRLPIEFVPSMADLASEELAAGDWQRALERLYWADTWLGRNSATDESWLQVHEAIAWAFLRLDLTEAATAEYERILASPFTPKSYQGRSQLKAERALLNIRIAAGDKHPAIPQELDRIAALGRNNRYLLLSFGDTVELARAAYLSNTGNLAAALAIADRLSAAGNLDAALLRIRLRLENNDLAGLENELIAALGRLREDGYKIEEASLYARYSDLLEKLGRPAEALAMCRESLRLLRSFDWFARIPYQLAKLSRLLGRCGDAAGAHTAAAEATRLAADTRRIPVRVAKEVADLLAAVGTTQLAAKEDQPSHAADLQPVRAVVSPVAGMAWRGRATLANPTATQVSGILLVTRQHTTLNWDPAGQVGSITISAGPAATSHEKLSIAPGTIAVLNLQADPAATLAGELTLTWQELGKTRQTAVWSLTPPESGVSAAVIDAGEYQQNPFYSVPIHHHYQNAAKDARRASIRIVASGAARVEIYDAADHPVAIDAAGDGSLADAGDSVFQDADFDGVADVPLTAGETTLRLQVYPAAAIPAQGMQVTIESLINGVWQAVAQDRIQP